MKRRLAGKAEPYEKKVATALIHGGFDSLILDELRAMGALVPGSETFRILADRKLAPADAALAIRLASHRYVDTRLYAQWLGRRANLRPPSSMEPQAYFLRLLDEASASLRLKH